MEKGTRSKERPTDSERTKIGDKQMTRNEPGDPKKTTTQLPSGFDSALFSLFFLFPGGVPIPLKTQPTKKTKRNPFVPMVTGASAGWIKRKPEGMAQFA